MPLLEAAEAARPGAFDVLAVTYKDFRPDAIRFTDRLEVTAAHPGYGCSKDKRT